MSEPVPPRRVVVLLGVPEDDDAVATVVAVYTAGALVPHSAADLAGDIDLPTLPRALDARGVGWRVYATGLPLLHRIDAAFRRPQSYDRFCPLPRFADDLAHGDLTEVTFVERPGPALVAAVAARAREVRVLVCQAAAGPRAWGAVWATLAGPAPGTGAEPRPR